VVRGDSGRGDGGAAVTLLNNNDDRFRSDISDSGDGSDISDSGDGSDNSEGDMWRCDPMTYVELSMDTVDTPETGRDFL
jgi:hypothetical protein